MNRLANLLAAGMLVACFGAAALLYATTYETRELAGEVHRLERQIEAAEIATAVLRAEYANLTRPERIERLARQHLKLRPASPAQLGAVGDLPWRSEVTAGAVSLPPIRAE